MPLIIMGNLDFNLAHPMTTRNMDLTTLVHQHQLEDAVSLFQQWLDRRYTWWQKCKNHKYHLANAQICSPDLYKSDHWALWILLPGATSAEHQCIKRHCSTLPTITPTTTTELIRNCKINILQEFKTTLKLEQAAHALEKQQCIKEAKAEANKCHQQLLQHITDLHNCQAQNTIPDSDLADLIKKAEAIANLDATDQLSTSSADTPYNPHTRSWISKDTWISIDHRHTLCKLGASEEQICPL